MPNKIYKRGGSKEIYKEYILKTKSNSPTEEDINMVYLMAGVRNAIFNTNDAFPELCPTSIAIVLLVNQFKFCSREQIKKDVRIGRRGMYTNLPKLIEYGYIDIYSPSQTAEYKEHHFVEGMGSYYSIEEKKVKNRFCLSSKGREVVRHFEKQLRTALDDGKPIKPNEDGYYERKFGLG